MKKLKCLLILVLSVIMFTAACGNSSSLDNQKSSDKGSDSKSGDYKPKELTVQFVPSQNADKLEAKAKPLENFCLKNWICQLKYPFLPTTIQLSKP